MKSINILASDKKHLNVTAEELFEDLVFDLLDSGPIGSHINIDTDAGVKKYEKYVESCAVYVLNQAIRNNS